ELLVQEGFEVNVAILPSGDDPDSFVQKHGREEYMKLLKTSRPYLEYLLDRSAAVHDLNNDEGRRQFLTAMLAVAARIPDPSARASRPNRMRHGRQTVAPGKSSSFAPNAILSKSSAKFDGYRKPVSKPTHASSRKSSRSRVNSRNCPGRFIDDAPAPQHETR